LEIKIKNAIQNNHNKHTVALTKKKELIVPTESIQVGMDKKAEQTIRRLSDFRANALQDPKGYRRLKQFTCLVKAHALLRTTTRPFVNDQDIQFIKRIDAYISYDTVTPL